MNVSVIIPALNEQATIGKAVTSAWQSGAWEVIVADGGSQDETREIARAADAMVTTSECGRGLQLNTGAAQAAGQTLLFLHADSKLDPGCLEQIRQALVPPRVVCGAFRQRITHDGWRYRLLERGNAARVRWFGIPYGDQGIFVRRDVFEAAGGFPEVPIMEELGFWQRMRTHGRPVLLPGPLYVNPRRWMQHGVVRQTARNWCLLSAYALGASPQQLARHYRPHEP